MYIIYSMCCAVLCLVTQLCPNRFDPMDWSLLGSSIHGDSPGKNTGVGFHALLQEIFPTQGSNLGLPHYRQILYHLSHQKVPNTIYVSISSVSSVTQSCPTLCDPMNCSMPGLPVHHQLPEFTQTHAHWVDDVIQPSHPLLSPSPPAFNLSQHEGLFQWVSSEHQVAKVLELQLQHQSFQWTLRTIFPLGWTGLISLQFKGL